MSDSFTGFLEKVLTDVKKVLTNDEVLIGIAKGAEIAGALTRTFSALSEKGSATQKGLQVATGLLTGVSKGAGIQVVGGSEAGVLVGHLMNGVATAGQMGAAAVGGSGTFGKLAGTAGAIGSTGTDLYVMERARRLAQQSTLELPRPGGYEIEPPTIDVTPEHIDDSSVPSVRTPPKASYRFTESKKSGPPVNQNWVLPVTRIVSGMAEVGAVWSNAESVPNKVCGTASAASNAFIRHKINKSLAESPGEKAVGFGTNVLETVGALAGVYAPSLTKVVDISTALSSGVRGVQQAHQLGRSKKRAGSNARRRQKLLANTDKILAEAKGKPTSFRTLEVSPAAPKSTDGKNDSE